MSRTTPAQAGFLFFFFSIRRAVRLSMVLRLSSAHCWRCRVNVLVPIHLAHGQHEHGFQIVEEAHLEAALSRLAEADVAAEKAFYAWLLWINAAENAFVL
ncbi:hypothetical protein VI26_16660 [Chromobacterium sp. LK1]|uniref:hypothetical protein n=1 Tax=Chromobacterium sp. LK1 TaxID=1628193 RepID=UPI000652DEF4|nr:hypothetical protein [Chromobacterium sp. LK1]KMN32750.1 hypothetical protein VI26_16660 [Chromobacterium sp. LK1]